MFCEKTLLGNNLKDWKQQRLRDSKLAQLRWLEPCDLNLEYMGVSHSDCVSTGGPDVVCDLHLSL